MESAYPVLLLIKLPPPLHGASYMNSLVQEIVSKQPDIQPKIVNIMSSSSAEDIGKSSAAKVFRIFAIYWRVLMSIITSHFSLIYLTIAPDGKGFWKDSPILWMLKLSRTPVLVHMHGKGIRRASQRNPFFAWYYRQVFKGLYVIVLSELLRSDIEHLVPGDKIYVLNNGIPDVQIMQKTEKGPTGKALFLSTMSRDKGIFRILDAIAWLKDEGFSTSVSFAGPWASREEEKEFFHRIEDRGLNDMVEYLGVLRGEDKKRVLQAASCMLLPTRYPYECFPVSILEALRAGLPVIASDEGAIPDIIQDGMNGFIIDPDDPEEFGNALRSLLNEKSDYARICHGARKSYEERFSLDRFGQRLLYILKSCSYVQKLS